MNPSDILIRSIKDEKVIEARLLRSSVGRRAAQKLLIEGEEAIRWALASPSRVHYIFVHEALESEPFTKELITNEIPLYFATEGVLKKISDTSYLIPYLAVASFPVADKSCEDILVVLDGLNDLGNRGTIVRTAAAFGIHSFAATSADFDLFFKKTIDASRGQVFSTHLRCFATSKEAARALKKEGYQIAVTSPHASIIQSFAPLTAKPLALVLGNETTGVSDDLMEEADLKIQIPMSGTVESLNVAVAAGISLYELKLKLVLTMLTKKIQSSLAGKLYNAATWMRLIFDKKLREGTPFNADQAIIMMILHCDRSSTASALAHDAGLSNESNIQELLKPLIEQGFIKEQEKTFMLTEKGAEGLAKIWAIHELTEHIALEGIPAHEQELFLKTLEQILKNCERITPYS